MAQQVVALRRLLLALAMISTGLVAGCSGSADVARVGTADGAKQGEQIEIADNTGIKRVPRAPQGVAAADPRMSELLGALGIESTPQTGDQKPDVILVGAAENSQLSRLRAWEPGAVVVDLVPREGVPLDWELVRQVQVLGAIFDREEDAKRLDEEFSQALVRAREAYDEKWKCTLLTIHDGELSVQPPEQDLLWQPIFDMVGMSVAEDQGHTDALVIREKAANFRHEDYVPARKQLAASADWNNNAAVKSGNVYVGPFRAPETASIITYTQMLNELADLWSSVEGKH